MRRAVTEPAVATSAPSTAIETLFSHPDVRIVSFTTSSSARGMDGVRGPHDEDDGRLSWYSPPERTIAVGKNDSADERRSMELTKI